ncbi:MAG: hypothetical protein R3E08_12420 [Thiotrichaceae bacterium]
MTQSNRIPKVVADFAHPQDKQDVCHSCRLKIGSLLKKLNNGWTVVAQSWENKQSDRKSNFYLQCIAFNE